MPETTPIIGQAVKKTLRLANPMVCTNLNFKNKSHS